MLLLLMACVLTVWLLTFTAEKLRHGKLPIYHAIKRRKIVTYKFLIVKVTSVAYQLITSADPFLNGIVNKNSLIVPEKLFSVQM